jgi:hypothetical protein
MDDERPKDAKQRRPPIAFLPLDSLRSVSVPASSTFDAPRTVLGKNVRRTFDNGPAFQRRGTIVSLIRVP